MEYLRQKRIVGVLVLFLALLLPLIYRIGFIQFVQGEEYARRAWEQRTVKVVLESNERGNIFDNNLKSLLDSDYKMRLVVFPNLVTDKVSCSYKLALILGLPQIELLSRLENKANYWPEELSGEQITSIEALKLPGILVRPVHIRSGEHPLAVNTIGYLGKISSKAELARLRGKGTKQYTLGDIVGRSGLEYYYESELKGVKPEKAVAANLNANGQLIKGLGIENIDQGSDLGRLSLVLTLDKEIQTKVEEIMDTKQLQGAVVVMDAGTGDLLALASRPTYQPEKVEEYLNKKAEKMFLDQTILLTEPGSVFKIIVAAAALEEGLAEPQTIYQCGEQNLVPCNILKPHSAHTLAGAVAYSINPVFMRLGLALGAERLAEYARRFGLDNQQIIGYPYPADKRQSWDKIKTDLVNSSIGQGPVLVSPVQLTAMTNTIANQGIYIEPRLVRELRNSESEVVKRFPLGKSHRAVSAETARSMEEMLLGVTEKGTGRKAALSMYKVAGKTGSAQVSNTKQLNAWFSGYFPVGKPQYVITVLITNGTTGGESAAPVFQEIALDLSGRLR